MNTNEAKQIRIEEYLHSLGYSYAFSFFYCHFLTDLLVNEKMMI